MTNPVLVVRTAPRNGVDYLPETLQRLEECGGLDLFEERVIWADGREAFFPGWELRGSPEKLLGCRESGWSLMRWLAQKQAPWALVLEDDLLLSTNFLSFAYLSIVPSDAACVSFFDPRLDVPDERVMWMRRGETYAYSQAVKWDARGINYLAGIDHHTQKHPDPHGWDSGLRSFLMAKRDWRYGTVFPNPVQHIGQVTSVRCIGSRLKIHSKTYPGPAFDALELLSVKRIDVGP